MTIEDVELALVSMRIAWRTEELRQLKRQLRPLEAAFSAFEQQVTAQSGSLTSERDRLRHICSEIENYTARLHARLLADPDGHLSAIFTPEELREIGQLCGVDVPDSWFESELHATTSGAGWFSTDETWNETVHAEDQSSSRASSTELRDLYRQLARTFHPDLTENDAERSFREEIMLRINHAWHMRDIEEMREITAGVTDLIAGKLRSVSSYRLAWHHRELDRLDTECESIRDRISSLRSSKTVALWHNPSLANVAISKHVSKLRQEIETLEMRRNSAMEEFRLALGTYASAR